jgi:hypothetical protein
MLNKNKIKRSIALVMVSGLSILTITGCSDSGSKNSNSSNGKTSVTTSLSGLEIAISEYRESSEADAKNSEKSPVSTKSASTTASSKVTSKAKPAVTTTTTRKKSSGGVVAQPSPYNGGAVAQRITCAHCGGSKTEQCSECHGLGTIQVKTGNGGAGAYGQKSSYEKVKCPSCTRGRRPCSDCNGKGYY